jgi:hypothetical protein
MTDPNADRAETVLLEGFADLPTLRYPMAWYADRLREGRPFTFVKRTHGFWDRLLDLTEASEPFRALMAEAYRRRSDDFPPWDELERAMRIDAQVERHLEGLRKYKRFWETGYPLDLVRELRHPPDAEGWIEAMALRAYTKAVVRPALHPPGPLREILLALAPRRRPWHYALALKDAAVTGELLLVTDAIRPFPVVSVGPAHIGGLGRALGLPRFRHVAIHETEAIADRVRVLRSLREVLSSAGHRGEPVVVLLQAGSLTWWLQYRIFPEFPRATLLDIGRTLDLWFPEVVEKQPWFQFDREAIVRNMRLPAGDAPAGRGRS